MRERKKRRKKSFKRERETERETHLVALVDHEVAQRPELEVALLGELLDSPGRADDDVRRGGPLQDVLVLLDGQASEEVGDADA